MFKFFSFRPTWHEPSALVKKVLLYISSGTVLDLGAGYGRNSAFLASHGFSVNAVELESAQVESLRTKSARLTLPITVVQADMTHFTSSSVFDVILANHSLHFCAPKSIDAVFKRMKDMTAPGGLHVVSGYTNRNPKGLRPYLFDTNELLHRYEGWEILYYTQDASGHPSVTPKAPTDNGPAKRYVTEIIARRPFL